MTGERLRIFLSGDVMTGRGIDQIQAKPGDSALYETWVKSAIRYVEIAERSHGAMSVLVLAHMGRPTIRAMDRGERSPFGSFGHDGALFEPRRWRR